MPLKRAANEHADGTYGLELPLKPGETKIEVNYRLPYEGSFSFEKAGGKLLLAGAPEVSVIAPLDAVKLDSPLLKLEKQEASQGAAFYNWTSTQPLKFGISGILPEKAEGEAPPQSSGPGAGGDANSSEDLSTMENQNFVFQVRWKILIVLAAALTLGLANLFRTPLKK